MRALLIWKTVTLRYYLRHPGRALLCLAGVAAGVAVSSSINLASAGIIRSFSKSVEAVRGESDLRLYSPEPIPASAIGRLRFLWSYGSFSPYITLRAAGKGRPVTLYGFDFVGDRHIRDYLFSSRNNPATGAKEEANAFDYRLFSGIIVPDDSPLGKRGETATLVIDGRRYRLPVTGLLHEINGRKPPPDTAYMDLSLLYPVTKGVSGVDVRLNNRSDQEKMRLRLQSLFPAASVRTTGEETRMTTQMLAAFRMNLRALGLVALLVSAYLVYNTMNISVLQRRRSISLFATLGALPRDLFGALLLEGAFFGLAGGAVGLLLGFWLSRFVQGDLSGTLSSVFETGGSEGENFSMATAIASYLLGLLFSVFAAIHPASSAARIPSARGMRRGASEYSRVMVGRAGLISGIFLFFTAVAFGVSVTFESALSGIIAVISSLFALSFASPLLLDLLARLARLLFRSGSMLLAAAVVRQHILRISIAVAALGVALSMASSVTVMVHSFRGTVQSWLATRISADIYIRSRSGENMVIGHLDPAVEKVVGEAKVASDLLPFYRRTLAVHGRDADITGSDLEALHNHGAYVPLSGGMESLLFAKRERGILASEVFANTFHVESGDALTLAGKELRIRGIFRDFSSQRGALLMDDSLYLELFPGARPEALSLYLRDGENVEEAVATLRRHLSGFSLEISRSAAVRREALKVFDRTFRMTELLQLVAFGIASLSLMAALASMVIERRGDLAVLLSLGARNGMLALSTILEALLITAASLLVAAPGGALLSFFLVHLINRYSFGWTILTQVPWGELLLTGIGLVLIAPLSALPALRMIRERRIAGILKEESLQ